jgi:hypothetical protein
MANPHKTASCLYVSPKTGIFALGPTNHRQITRDLQTKEMIHPSVFMQKKLAPVHNIGAFPDLVVGLLPLEENMKRRWKTFHGDGTRQETAGDKVMRNGVGGLVSTLSNKAVKTVRSATVGEKWVPQEKFHHKIWRAIDERTDPNLKKQGQ